VINRTLSPLPCRSQQRGATLLVTLVFVIVLSMLGIGAAQNNSFQELMGGSTRDRELAFEAAEAALQDAKATFATWRTQPFTSTITNGLSLYVATNSNSPDWWNASAQWPNYRTPTLNITRAIKQPQYRIEKMPDVGTVQYFRVTARGFGAAGTAADPTTIVILQAEYRYTP
jgi:type IV pilus assembly protein PilX